MTFPSLASAEEYLRGKLQDFYNQRGVLSGRLAAIVKLKESAFKQNNQQALGQLELLRSGVLALLREQLDMEDRLEPFRQYFGVTIWRPTNLGVLPVVLAVGAVAVATALYLYYEKLSNQGKALDLVARGLMSTEEADAILNPSFFSGLGGSFASVGLLGIAGLLGLYFLTRRTA